MRRIWLPLTKDIVKTLRRGEEVLLSGVLLTARDAAHKRLVEAVKAKKKLPVSLKGETIYYTGPTLARPGKVIGSCGPTTSSRMDPFTLALLKHGLIGMIGKGERSIDVARSIKKYKAVYFIAVGGAGAYLSKKVRSKNVVAYKDLGTEAILRLVVKDFPVVVSVK
ncbi:MAG: FumA C-terminus/TtdB family hydratase beta subunit [Candidatus Omnitrophota bacterium]|jgi:fumarate hydratase subunit beta|nr:FumA C-terminus/TtdB family hydratase beta subunit [Candidatus Omnitrophota bacterium]|tara:strand:+ start:1333 stop:1830 length:498 start_codon:yes stop_codon:yes gene_type:complete